MLADDAVIAAATLLDAERCLDILSILVLGVDGMRRDGHCLRHCRTHAICAHDEGRSDIFFFHLRFNPHATEPRSE